MLSPRQTSDDFLGYFPCFPFWGDKRREIALGPILERLAIIVVNGCLGLGSEQFSPGACLLAATALEQ
jgi:hypothetical protein